MIAESTPQHFAIGEKTHSPDNAVTFEKRTASQIWNQWFYRFFQYIYVNSDVIRAVAYINAHWDEQGMWGGPIYTNGYWGDSRIEANDLIKKLWLNQISREIWQHGSTTGFTEYSGFNQAANTGIPESPHSQWSDYEHYPSAFVFFSMSNSFVAMNL
ncbi:MAG: hypothetical protein JW822_14305 [Spirochaetales bacterium]|nr:hypothetical protein [Spirochaetales bacterium]